MASFFELNLGVLTTILTYMNKNNILLQSQQDLQIIKHHLKIQNIDQAIASGNKPSWISMQQNHAIGFIELYESNAKY